MSKTIKRQRQLGDSWARQWELRGQFTGYCWAAREAGIDVNGVLVRGVSILKTKYGSAQAITNREPLGNRQVARADSYGTFADSPKPTKKTGSTTTSATPATATADASSGKSASPPILSDG